MPSSAEKFPEVYTGGKMPAAFAFRDPGRKALTPVYTYGWLVSRADLYEAMNGEKAGMERFLSLVYMDAERLLSMSWVEKGYHVDSEYNPAIPRVDQHNSKYVLIFMACNDSDAVVKSITENKKYHEECRACLRYPKTMKSEPAWIRVGMKHVPEELSGSVADSNVVQ